LRFAEQVSLEQRCWVRHLPDLYVVNAAEYYMMNCDVKIGLEMSPSDQI